MPGHWPVRSDDRESQIPPPDPDDEDGGCAGGT